jgi:hypothetical protein
MNMGHRLRYGLSAALCLLAAACNTTAVNKDAKTTQLDSYDMVTMTNQMADSINSDPRIHAALAAGQLKVVIKPVENLTNDIITGDQCQLFVARLQSLLATQPGLRERFVWCINRADYEKLRKEEIPEAKLGPSEDRIVPEYALYAEFHADTRVTRNTRSDTYLCVYKLTRISNGGEGAILWSGEYQTSKAVKRGFLD